MRVTWPIILTAITTCIVAAYLLAHHDVASSEIVVLYSRADPPAFRTSCPEGRCTFIAVEEFSCPPLVGSAPAMIITGHSSPPEYLNRTVEEIASVVRCFKPDLIVLDTCYGFSTPLLEALSAERSGTLVLGPTYKLPPGGLIYENKFFESGSAVEERARYVHSRSGAKLERWRLESVTLQAALRQVNGWDPPTLEANLQRKQPNLVRVGIPGADAYALVPVPPARFKR